MAIAHDLFCADSPAALAATGVPGGKERAVLLISAMTRAAALDPFETGDVWAKLAALRPPADAPPPDRRADAIAAMRRLLTADAAQRQHAEPGWAGRVAAFEDAGRQLAFLAADGRLARGLRSVLAHHLIFAFNRAGVPARAQTAAAWLAVQAAFGDDGPTGAFTGRSAAATPTIGRMETIITTTTPPDPVQLRAAMVGSLTAGGHLRAPEIITAFTETERHLFLPRTDLADAYGNDAVPVKHDGDGEMISCISAPSIVATQLEQLGVRPGDKVLEAGAATGYNAALLARLAGPAGHVWTVDVDEDLVRDAAAHLKAAGVANATVVLGDGAVGLPGCGPFDRVQFTVGSADISPEILDQVAPGGRLVVPGFTPHFSWGSMAALDGGTLAYLTVREGDDDTGRFWEIGTVGHGPRAAALSRDVADAIREWDRDYGNQAPAPGWPHGHHHVRRRPGRGASAGPPAAGDPGRRAVIPR